MESSLFERLVEDLRLLALVEAQGGSIVARNRTPRGLEVSIVLPINAHQPMN